MSKFLPLGNYTEEIAQSLQSINFKGKKIKNLRKGGPGK